MIYVRVIWLWRMLRHLYYVSVVPSTAGKPWWVTEGRPLRVRNTCTSTYGVQYSTVRQFSLAHGGLKEMTAVCKGLLICVFTFRLKYHWMLFMMNWQYAIICSGNGLVLSRDRLLYRPVMMCTQCVNRHLLDFIQEKTRIHTFATLSMLRESLC